MAHDHSHDHRGHDHRAADDVSTGRLLGAAGLNVVFAAIQVVVGLVLASVVVLADALHQVVDAVGLVTALVAVAMARRPARDDMTYGWGKADALGGYTSALLLLGSVAWVAFEAVQRLRDPVDVDGTGVIAIGVAGIVVNGGSLLALGHGHHLSLRAARLHLVVDLAGSVIVVLTGAVLAGTEAHWVDPAASLLVNALVVHGTFRLLRAAGAELLDRAPASATVEAVHAAIEGRPGIESVHHVHTRSIGPDVSSVTAHVVVAGDLSLHEAQAHLVALRHDLAERLGIEHSTIQLECHECPDTVH